VTQESSSAGAHFFTFPPAGSTNKRVGKVCLTFLPNFVSNDDDDEAHLTKFKKIQKGTKMTSKT
jgi:hypothetical protein